MTVEQWAKLYSGPKFHALLSDPPYELGFMGKGWDKQGVAFHPDTWASLAEHLHPGAFVMAFASSRGWHRLACAIEDAGLIIHPSLFGWAFGCLSEDSEILTSDGWKSYTDFMVGDSVACYNIDTDNIEFMPCSEVYIYDYDETAYHIQSDDTDQIVSRNHRCIVKRGERYEFVRAEHLQSQEITPFARPAQRQDELQSETQTQGRGYYLPHLWQRKIYASRLVTQDQGRSNMRDGMPKQTKITRPGFIGTIKSYFTTRLTSHNAGKSQKGRYAWVAKSRLEGWGNATASAWQLCISQVCEMSRRIYQYVAPRWVRYGASPSGSAAFEQTVIENRGCTSYQSRPARQSPRKPDVIREQSTPQAVRTSWRTAPTVATVTPIHYTGKVWCVKVPTGAFVARRNGQVFVTGNSGFPKATRIDTAIDKAAGATREIIGSHTKAGDIKGGRLHAGSNEIGVITEIVHTAPATPAAQAWEGHRYGRQALKPALEPIIVAQKPYTGRPVDSIVTTGAGSLWIDGGLIGNETITRTRFLGDMRSGNYGNARGKARTDLGKQTKVSIGRWPANFYLSHHPDCNGSCHPDCPVKKVGEQTILDPDGNAARFFFNADWSHEVAERLANADPVFYQGKATRDERDLGLGHLEKRFLATMNDGIGAREHNENEPTAWVRNNHPTVKPIALAEWLAKLLLPPSEYGPRRLLVPFAGSGSEIIGAYRAGWEFIEGVEMSRDYTKIARARVKRWQANGVQMALFPEVAA